MSDHSQKTKTGIKWSIFDQIVRQFFTIIIASILSRLLTPKEFGIMGLITLTIGFLQVLKDIGLGSSLIQKKDLTTEETSSIFWLNLFLGTLLAIFLFLSAQYISGFFNEPALVPLIKVMAITFVIGSLAIVPDSLMMKRLDFKSYFYRNFLVTVLSGGGAIILAFYGFGVWALVIQNCISSIVTVIIGFLLVKWRPSFHFQKFQIRKHLRFSLPLVGDSSINYWVRNIDNLLVGKVKGTAQLGIYNRAYSLMLLPISQISNTISRVMFPSLSLIQEDDQKVWEQYKNMTSVVAVISFPLMAFLGVYSKEVIILIYGPQWLEVVPIFRVLCFIGAVQSIATLSGPIFYAKGKTFLMFKVGIFSKALMISGIIIGMFSGGMLGMVWGYVVVSFVSFLFETYFVTKVLKQTVYFFLKNLLPEIIVTIFYLVGLIFVQQILGFNLDNFSASNILLNSISLLVLSIACCYLLKYFNSKGLKIIISNFNVRK